MKVRQIATVLLLIVRASSLLHAQQTGQQVVVIEPAPLKVNDTVLETLPPGTSLLVRNVQGEWLSVTHRHSGWVHRRQVRGLPEAIEHFSRALERNPDDLAARILRGVLRNAAGEYDQAIADFTAVLRVQPKLRAAYANRAISWKNRGEYDIALADYNEAIRLDPQVGLTWHNRGQVWLATSRYGKAASDFAEAIRLDPDSPEGHNAIAWLQATCPDASLRSGAQAVRDALRACELSDYGHWQYVGTLAAAYAEAGDFASAVAWEQKCLELAPPEKQPEVQQRLKAFQSGTPWRDSFSPVAVSALH